MYVIAVYDVGEKRVGKVLKLMRKYLFWQQRSVFEGELSEGQIEELLERCGSIINEAEDSIMLYVMDTDKYLDRRTVGKERDVRVSNFI